MSSLIKEEEFINIFRNLNEGGLKFLTATCEALNNFERYNKNTSPERLVEIQQIDDEKAEQDKRCQEKASYERANKRASESYIRQQEYRVSLTGRDKRFFEIVDNIKIGQSLGLARWQLRLLYELYDNNLIDGSFDIYKYGFLHGQDAERNRQNVKRNPSVKHKTA